MRNILTWNIFKHSSVIWWLDCLVCMKTIKRSSIAMYGYSRTVALHLCTCACTLKMDVALSCTYYPIYVECTTIRARVANKNCLTLTYLQFLQLAWLVGKIKTSSLTHQEQMSPNLYNNSVNGTFANRFSLCKNRKILLFVMIW